MNYKLAKRLKEAGFPQRWTMGRFYAENDAEFKMIGEYQDKLKFVDNAHKFIDIPTLSELIEACGDDFSSLHSVVGGFRADGNDEKCQCDSSECDSKRHFEEMGKTPEEAIANLWLKLNEK